MISKNQISFIKSLHLKKNRDAEQLFIAEGVKTVLELINDKNNLVTQLYAEVDFIEKNKKLLEDSNVNCFEVNERELQRISLQVAPNKVLAVCNYFKGRDIKINGTKDFCIFLDDIRDPGNFGTIIRLASWFGVKTIFCSPTTCELYNSKVIQASMGAFLRVNCVYMNLEEVIKTYGFSKIYGAFLEGDNFYKQQLNNGLLVIGNEANGIGQENIKHVTQKITIPSHSENNTESLNAGTATAILLSEFFRQKNY